MGLLEGEVEQGREATCYAVIGKWLLDVSWAVGLHPARVEPEEEATEMVVWTCTMEK